MACPLCGTRKARRACPAVGAPICPVCCGTKRLTEIRCPPDCTYLITARDHPPAAALRQQQQDTARLLHAMRDLNRDQSRLFLAVSAFVAQYQPPDIQPVVDADVADAAGALAGTFETAARGVIYDHRPSSRQAERLMTNLRPFLEETARRAGGTHERDAAVVLRRIEEIARDPENANLDAGRAYLGLVSRMFRSSATGEPAAPGSAPVSRLIVP